jgi:DNA-binding MarR family transcriptional regulator
MCIYIYFNMSQSQLPALPCLCSSVRRASRALTQRYEQTLRPFGLRATQFTILQVLAIAGEVPQGQLGEMLAMDSTTLTRTLQIIINQGWVAERRGGEVRPGENPPQKEDRRQRWLHLAPAGKAQLDRALPAWKKVQSQLQRELGEHSWKELFRLSDQLTNLATTPRD